MNTKRFELNSLEAGEDFLTPVSNHDSFLVGWLNIVMEFTEWKKEESKYSNREYNMSMIKMTVWRRGSFSRDIEINLRFGWLIAFVSKNEKANQNSSILPCSHCTEQRSAGRSRAVICSFILTFEWHLVPSATKKKKKHPELQRKWILPETNPTYVPVR